ncbi:MAG: mechanosensitive ion channel domain-containing protein [Bacteroidales bacterium]|nr:mechanosensitive ion channel [Tenuifilaceae bacterium]
MSLYFLLFAVVIFLVLRYLSRWLANVSTSSWLHNLLVRLFPLIEFIVWFAFGLWVFNNLLGSYSYYHIIIVSLALAIVLILGWYFLRDFISGIILKTEIPFEKQQRIGVGGVDGILVKVGYRSLEIETTNNQRIKIPYSKLASSSIHLFNQNEYTHSHKVTFKVDCDKPIHEIEANISRFLLLLPWVAPSSEPNVKVEQQADGDNMVTVNYYTVADRNAALVNQHLKNEFEK